MAALLRDHLHALLREEGYLRPPDDDPPILTAQGLTHMGGGIHKALDMVQARKAQYRANGIAYYRPWIFLITDGAPQGEPDGVVEQAAQRIREDEATNRIAFFAVGVE